MEYEVHCRDTGRWFGRRRGSESAARAASVNRSASSPDSEAHPVNARPSFGTDGYTLLSIVVHWLAAVLVIALFFTHEGGEGTAAYTFHVSGGALVGLFLLWRVWHRVRRGTPAPTQQAAFFNFVARIVHFALLVLIVAVVVSGYLLPWSMGRPFDLFGLGLPSPMAPSPELHEFLERVHDTGGHLFVPLLALHVLGALKHAVFDRRGAGLRMFKPARGGR